MGKLVGVFALCCVAVVLSVTVLVSAIVGGASSPSGASTPGVGGVVGGAGAFHQRRGSAQANRHIGAQGDSNGAQLGVARVQAPEMIEPFECRGRVTRAAANA